MNRAVSSLGLLRSFQLSLSVQGLRPATIRHYVRDVERFLDDSSDTSLPSITASVIRHWLAAYQKGHAPKTVREAQLALRRFFRFLLAEGELEKDPSAGIPLLNPRIRPQPIYTEEEVRLLLTTCDPKSDAGIRDRALLLTLYDTGVREGELTSMGLPDWERGTVLVDGKTGPRSVPLGETTLQALDRYVRRYQVTEPPLWWGKKGALTGSGVLQMLIRRCQRAGVEPKGVHAFRRAAAAQMKRLGMNDSDILEVMGWRSVEMLRRYTAPVAAELAHRAHRRFSPGDALGSGRLPTGATRPTRDGWILTPPSRGRSVIRHPSWS